MKSLRNLLVLIVCLATRPAMGIDVPDGIPTAPHDWDCAYAFSDTTCRTMINAWADDIGLTNADALQDKTCSRCERREEVGGYGIKYLVGYDCVNRFGHELRGSGLDEKVSIFRRSSSPDEGWEVENWSFHKCLITWECSTKCAIDFDVASCIPVSAYSIGRYKPTLGRNCTLRVYEKQSQATYQEIESSERTEFEEGTSGITTPTH